MDKRRDSARDSQFNEAASGVVAMNKGTRRCKCRHARALHRREEEEEAEEEEEYHSAIMLRRIAKVRSTRITRARRAASFLHFAIRPP